MTVSIIQNKYIPLNFVNACVQHYNIERTAFKKWSNVKLTRLVTLLQSLFGALHTVHSPLPPLTVLQQSPSAVSSTRFRLSIGVIQHWSRRFTRSSSLCCNWNESLKNVLLHTDSFSAQGEQLLRSNLDTALYIFITIL